MWLADNFGTILVGGILLAVVSLIVRSLWRNKKSGGRSCHGNCSECLIKNFHSSSK